MSAASDHRNVPAVSTPKRTRELMERYGIGAKKSLGQNFLIDQNILQKIVDAAELAPDSGVLEIGPGLGALTEKLAQAAGTVVAVEIDHRLFPALREVLAPFDNVRLVHGNILEMDLPALFQEHFRGVRDVRVAANLPYYITTPILMKLLESALPLACIVVMVQKEVAERMSAAPGGKDYGSLSIAVQYYCETDVVAHVPKTVFIPAPGVDSAVIRLRMRRKPAVEVRDVRFFFDVVQASFAQRRKTIHNNLLARFFAKSPECKPRVAELLQECGIDPGRRGETLTMAEFAALSDRLLDLVEAQKR